MTAAVTEWFPGDQKPEIVGVYERKWPSGEPFHCPFYLWDGKNWLGYGCVFAREAAKAKNQSIFQEAAPWRGLASDPKGIK